MSRNNNKTSAKVASVASKILKDGRFSKEAKMVAGAALSNAKRK